MPAEIRETRVMEMTSSIKVNPRWDAARLRVRVKAPKTNGQSLKWNSCRNLSDKAIDYETPGELQ